MQQASKPRQIPYPQRTTALQIPPPAAVSLPPPPTSASRIRNSHLNLDSFSPVNQNGSFEFDRVLKSGLVQKRTRKTKVRKPSERIQSRVHTNHPQTWKPIYLVLRANFLSIYKDQNEDKLRHKIHLADLTAVAFLKDPKHKRENVFGLFSPSRNYHLEATSRKDAEEWVELIRREARIEEEEEEMLLASPGGNATGTYSGFERTMRQQRRNNESNRLHDERLGSSSPEPLEPMPMPRPQSKTSAPRRTSHTLEYSGNELSDMSDTDFAARAIPANSSLSADEPLAVQPPPQKRPFLGPRNASQMSILNPSSDPDPERVIWQGRLLYLKTKNGIRQWKDLWAVIRPRCIQFYKNDAEYSTLMIIPLNSVLSAVEVDPLSKTKRACCQVITEEKSYKFCARDEGSLDGCLGALKSLLARRKEMGGR